MEEANKKAVDTEKINDAEINQEQADLTDEELKDVQGGSSIHKPGKGSGIQLY